MADNELQRRSFLRGLIVGTTALAANELGVIVKASPQDVEAFGTVQDRPVDVSANRGPFPISPNTELAPAEAYQHMIPDYIVYNCLGQPLCHVKSFDIRAAVDEAMTLRIEGYVLPLREGGRMVETTTLGSPYRIYGPR